MDVQCGKQFVHLFSSLYSTEDILAFIVRGHLYCEAALSGLLNSSLKNPEELDTDRLDYSTKVDLCSALGLFAEDLKPGLKQLGKLRNKIVHNLEYKITEQDQMDFINTLRSTLGEPAEYYFSFSCATEFPNGLCRCVQCLWISLQIKNGSDPEEVKEKLSQIVYVSMKMSGLDNEKFFDMCNQRVEDFYSKK